MAQSVDVPLGKKQLVMREKRDREKERITKIEIKNSAHSLAGTLLFSRATHKWEGSGKKRASPHSVVGTLLYSRATHQWERKRRRRPFYF